MPQARPALPVNEVPPLSREKRNENTVKILKDYTDILEEMIEDMIEDPPAPAVKLTPRQRHDWFMAKIADTYAGDVFGMQAEIAVLMDETLVDRIKAAMQAMRQGEPVELPMLPASQPSASNGTRSAFCILHFAFCITTVQKKARAM